MDSAEPYDISLEAMHDQLDSTITRVDRRKTSGNRLSQA